MTDDRTLLTAVFPVAVIVLSWLLTYLLHSSALLGTVWLVTRRMTARASALSESLWKAALVGAVLTATVQVFAGLQPFTGSVGLDPTPPGGAVAPSGGDTHSKRPLAPGAPSENSSLYCQTPI